VLNYIDLCDYYTAVQDEIDGWSVDLLLPIIWPRLKSRFFCNKHEQVDLSFCTSHMVLPISSFFAKVSVQDPVADVLQVKKSLITRDDYAISMEILRY
jgi:hypothetical protein